MQSLNMVTAPLSRLLSADLDRSMRHMAQNGNAKHVLRNGILEHVIQNADLNSSQTELVLFCA
jgi:hypothetical protein